MSPKEVYQLYGQIREHLKCLGHWQALTLALYSMGVVIAEKCIPSKVSEKCGAFGTPQTVQRRLERWLANERINWFGTVRGRLGLLVTPNWLVYGTGGFAYGGVEQQSTVTNVSDFSVVNSSFRCVRNAVCATGSRSETQGGWTAGAGSEYLLSGTTFFNRPVTVKVEYLYVNLGSNNLLIPTQSNPTVSFATQFGDIAFQTVRAGFNVKF